MFRKGTTLIRKLVRCLKDDNCRECILQLHCDIIGDSFWEENLEILRQESPQLFHKPDGMVSYEVKSVSAVNVSNIAEE